MTPSLFDAIKIKTNPWIPKNLIVAIDRFGQIVEVVDLKKFDARSKFFYLLNMGDE